MASSTYSRADAQARFQERARQEIDPDTANLVADVEITDELVSNLNKAIKEIAMTKMSEVTNAHAKSELLRVRVMKRHKLSARTLDQMINDQCIAAIGLDINGDRTSTISSSDDDDGWGDTSIPEIQHIVAGLVQEKGTTVIAARAGVGKTELIVAMCVAVMSGLPFPPFDDLPTNNPGKILFIASDQDDNALPQIEDSLFRCGVDGRDWAKGKIRLIAPNSAKGRPAWTATFKNLRLLKDLMETGEYGMVVIDSFRAIAAGTGWDATNNEQVLLLLKVLKAVVTPYAALVLIHHTGEESNRPGTASITEMASAKALGQNVDIAYILKPGVLTDGTEADYRVLHGVKIRGGFERIEAPYIRCPETCQMVVDRNALPSGAVTADHILQKLDSVKPTTADHIASELGIHRKTVSNNLQALKTRKMARMKGRGWVIKMAGKKHLEDVRSGMFVSSDSVPAAYDF